MPEKAFINPEIIVWARMTARMSPDEAACRLHVNADLLKSWENGIGYPTVSQAEKLSQIYRRPLAVFYLPKPPKDSHALPDFRAVGASGEYSTALTFIIRDIQQRQSWIREFLIEQGECALPFVGKLSENNTPEQIAGNMKEVLGIDDYIESENVLRNWINKVESKRIFLSFTSNVHTRLKIDAEEVRGFALCDDITPFIFINSNEHEDAQLFTLLHELAHIWINKPGVSNIEFRDYDPKHYDRTELFCNEVAAETLLPLKRVTDFFGENKEIDLDRIDNFAGFMKVSPYFVSVRLLKAGIINNGQFEQFQPVLRVRFEHELANKEKQRKRLKQQEGVLNVYSLQIKKNSRAFTHIVYDGYKEGKISGYDASLLLGVKLNKFNKLESFLFS